MGLTSRIVHQEGFGIFCRDGGLEASIDHEAGVMVCRESGDVYATAEPAAAFHARTAFCLDIHNEVCY